MPSAQAAAVARTRASARLRIAGALALVPAWALAADALPGSVTMSASPWRVAPKAPVEVTVVYAWRSPWHAAKEPSPTDAFAEDEVVALSPADRSASGGEERRVVRLRVVPPGAGAWTLPRAALRLVGPDGTEQVVRSDPVEVLVSEKPGTEPPIADPVLPAPRGAHQAWWLLAATLAIVGALIAWARVGALRLRRAPPATPEERFAALIDRARIALNPRASAALIALALRQRAGDACGFDGAATTAAEAAALAARGVGPSSSSRLAELLAALDGLRFAPEGIEPRRLDELCSAAVAWSGALARASAPAAEADARVVRR